MTGNRKRGFGSMNPEKQREIASKGGRAAHAKGSAHEFTSEEAKEAGRKGGRASHQKAAARQLVANQDDNTPQLESMGLRAHEAAPEADYATASSEVDFRGSNQP